MDTVKQIDELIARARIADPRKQDAVVATVLATWTFIESFMEFQHRPQGVLAMVAFTGISGSGKSSLAFGTLYAEAQRRYFESVAPYARRLLQQVGAPHVQEVTGLPPAVALQQRRGAATSRSSVGTLTTLSNLLRILYSRAGDYPAGADYLVKHPGGYDNHYARDLTF